MYAVYGSRNRKHGVISGSRNRKNGWQILYGSQSSKYIVLLVENKLKQRKHVFLCSSC